MSCANCAASVAAIHLLEGDDFIHMLCATCSFTGKTFYGRLSFSWAEVVHLALYHLCKTADPIEVDAIGRKYYSRNDIAQVIVDNKEYLWAKPLVATWKTLLQTNLSGSDKFVRLVESEKKKAPNVWALNHLTLPRTDVLGTNRRVIIGQLRLDDSSGKYRVFALNDHASKEKTDTSQEEPSISQEDFNDICNQRSNSMDDNAEYSLDVVKGENKRKIEVQFGQELHQSIDTVKNNSHAKRLKREHIDPKNCINIYPDLDNVKSPVVMCDHHTHSAPQMKISNGGKTVTTDRGYRLAKSSHGIWEGSWYFEVLVEDNPGHVRIGWSQISGDLQAPCGYDSFSYSFRDFPGTLFHQSKSIKDCPPAYLQGYGAGDVLGVFIHLPSLSESNRQELHRRLWNPRYNTEYSQIRAKPLQALKTAEIRYFKNGVDLGQAFSNIYFGKYHAAVSCYMGGKVTVNFGPKFKFPLRKGKPLCQASSIVFSPEAFLNGDLADDNPESNNEITEHTNNGDPMISNELEAPPQKAENMEDCIKSEDMS